MRPWIVLSLLPASLAFAEPAVTKDQPPPPAAPLPVAGEASPATVAPETPVPAGLRLAPRNDVVMAALSSRHSGAVDIRDLRLKAAVPLVRGDGYGGALLLGYGKTHLERDAHAELELHRFEAMLGGGAGLAPGWSLRFSAGAAFSSDLNDAPAHAWQATVAVMVHHVLGPADALVVGGVYVSSADFLPVLPIVGYVHQRAGSPLRLDVFLPRHVRAEYALGRRWQAALGVEAMGNTWAVQRGAAVLDVKRAGGALFAEMQLLATRLVRLEARAGMSVDSYTLPVDDTTAMTHASGLRAASFAQLAVIVAP